MLSSALYLQQMQHHAEELCLWEGIFEETDLAEFDLWAAIDIVGTMLPPKILSLPRSYKDNKLFKLLIILMQKYGHLDWGDGFNIVPKFIAEPRCIESWHNSWRLGLKHLQDVRA